MVLKFVLLMALATISVAKDDQRWVWGDSNRAETIGRPNFHREERYEVYEPERPYRPSESYHERPYYKPELTNINRPGGVYGQGYPQGSGNYGQAHPHYPTEVTNSDILTGPIPSWVKEGPFKNYDKCKCTEKFNCNSPGISYGHCDVGKQYCCYVSKKQEQIGGPLPSRPHHSIDNGILVGPGGPVDIPRPGGFRPNRPIGNFGFNGNRGDYGNHRPIHSAENGILVGPGGPYDRPIGGRPTSYGGGGFGLTRTKN